VITSPTCYICYIYSYESPGAGVELDAQCSSRRDGHAAWGKWLILWGSGHAAVTVQVKSSAEGSDHLWRTLLTDSAAVGPAAPRGVFVIVAKAGHCNLNRNADELLHCFQIYHRISLFWILVLLKWPCPFNWKILGGGTVF